VLGSALNYAGQSFDFEKLAEEVRLLLEHGGHVSSLAAEDVKSIVDQIDSTHGQRTLLVLLMNLTPPSAWPESGWVGEIMMPRKYEREMMNYTWFFNWIQKEVPEDILFYIGRTSWASLLSDPNVPRDERIEVVKILSSLHIKQGKQATADGGAERGRLCGDTAEESAVFTKKGKRQQVR